MNIRAVILGLNPYVNWLPLATIPGGKNSLTVYRLPNAVIKKVYDSTNLKHVELFKHECDVLRQLKGCDFTPQLLFADEKLCTVYMTDCGSPRPIPSVTPTMDGSTALATMKEVSRLTNKHLATIRPLLTRLETEYRVKRTGNPPSTDNIIGLRGKTYIVGFSDPHWSILPPIELPKHHPIQDFSANKKLNTLTAQTILKSTSPIVDG